MTVRDLILSILELCQVGSFLLSIFFGCKVMLSLVRRTAKVGYRQTRREVSDLAAQLRNRDVRWMLASGAVSQALIWTLEAIKDG